jgi:hypothetical protein
VLVKTPLTLFALLALAMAWNIHNWRLSGSERAQRTAAMSRSLYRSAPLLTLFVVYWLFAISSHLNIGHRHILPTYPPMLVFAGCAWMWVTERRNAQAETRRSGASDKRGASSVTTWLRSRRHPILAAAVVASLVSFGTESLLNWPNYLAYVNQLPGNHSNAYRHLVDSSLDWGQDLPALKNWLAEAGLIGSTQGSYLAYFGGDNPAYYGIRAQQLPGFWDRTSAGIPEPLTPGTYCVSATLVQNMYSRFPGRWNQEYEATYQQLAGKVQRFRALGPEERKALLAGKDGAAWLNMFQSYEHARFARLTSFLRQREPQTEINYSILIYQLARDDIQRAVNGPPVELRNFPDFRGP